MLSVLSILVVFGISQYGSEESSADSDGTYVVGGVTYELFDTGTGYTATASWDGTSSEVTIEASVVLNDKTYVVDRLNKFDANSVVTKVTIKSNSQLVISDFTFYNNNALTTIELGEEIKVLPAYFCAFSDVNNAHLTAVNLENVESIGSYAFQRCSTLVSVDLSKAENIGSYAFDECTALNEITFSPQLETIGDHAFQRCLGLHSISLPGTIISFCLKSFYLCTALENVTLDTDFRTIGDSMFEGCSALKSIDLKNVQGIGAGAFRNCTALESITIPDTTKAIGKLAFDGCTSLTSCDLGTGLERLENQVFQGCPIAGKMVLPASLSTITVFSGSSPTFPLGLSEIEVDPANQFFASKDGMLYDKALSIVLFCPREKTGEITIAASVSDYALSGCHFEKIVIANGAATIGICAFSAKEGDPTLKEIVFPDTLESMGNYVFRYQTELKVIVLPSNLGSLGGNLFNGLTGLQYIEFPDTSFTTTSKLSFNKVTFKLSDGSTVPASTVGGTVSSLQGARFIRDGTAATTFNQIADDEVLLTKIVNGDATYSAIAKGSPLAAPIAPEAPAGLSFVGWFTDSLMSVAYSNMDAVTADLTLYAKFIPETHTVTYKVDGEVVGEVKTYDYGTELSVNNVYEKIGYTVSDWSCTGATLVDGKITIKGEDVVFTATSTVNQYTITFDTAGGSAIAAITQDYDSDVTAPEAPTRTGYTFAGWSAEVPAKMPVDGMTITASWTINQYTITFDTAGGSAIAAITQDYNTSVTAPAVEPSRDGYRFVKWDSEIPASMPADDVIIKAVWAIVATVGENGKSVVTLDSETSSFIPAAETKEITVEIRENTAVKVENASDLIGKTVVSKVEPVSNSTGVSGTAYEFTFTADGTQYNGKIQVTLPYTKEDGKEPVVYYWNGSESTKMNVVSSTDASVTFETDHNSMYVVASETPSKDDGASFLLYFGILIVAGICAAVLIGFNFYHKKA